MMADEMLDRGYQNGLAAWKRLLKAVEALLSTRPEGRRLQ